MSRINDKLKLAMARYYQGRESQYIDRRVDGTTMTVRMFNEEAPQWDKQAALDAIAAAAKKSGFGLRASSGTFWFIKGRESIECNESTYLNGGVRTLKKPPKSPVGSLDTRN